MLKFKFKTEENAVEAQKVIASRYEGLTEVRRDCIYTLEELTYDQITEIEDIVKKFGGEASMVVGLI